MSAPPLTPHAAFLVVLDSQHPGTWVLSARSSQEPQIQSTLPGTDEKLYLMNGLNYHSCKKLYTKNTNCLDFVRR